MHLTLKLQTLTCRQNVVFVYPALKFKCLHIIMNDLVIQLVSASYIMILKITLYELPMNYSLTKFETKEEKNLLLVISLKRGLQQSFMGANSRLPFFNWQNRDAKQSLDYCHLKNTLFCIWGYVPSLALFQIDEMYVRLLEANPLSQPKVTCLNCVRCTCATWTNIMCHRNTKSTSWLNLSTFLI